MVKKVNKQAEDDMFKAMFADAKPVKHDHFIQDPKEKRQLKKKSSQGQNKLQRRIAASFEFSDGFEAYFEPNKPLKYAQDNPFAVQGVKRIRRGEMVPDLSLDLHGLNSEQTKLELSAIIDEATRKHYECIQVIHGVSGGVLKHKVPNYLVQHPKVLCFHQAPLEWGGKGALLVLLEASSTFI